MKKEQNLFEFLLKCENGHIQCVCFGSICLTVEYIKVYLYKNKIEFWHNKSDEILISATENSIKSKIIRIFNKNYKSNVVNKIKFISNKKRGHILSGGDFIFSFMPFSKNDIDNFELGIIIKKAGSNKQYDLF